MFIIEGLPTTLIGLFVSFYLSDKPGEAAWLTAEEQAVVARDLRAEQTDAGGHEHGLRSWTTMRSPVIYLMALGWFCFICGIYMISFWLPTIIRQMGMPNRCTSGFPRRLPTLGH